MNTSPNPYQPFIDDPKHRHELDRQRFVVLRMPPAIDGMWGRVQQTVRQRVPVKLISYPVHAHVTLCGFAAGATLEAVQEVVTSWAESTPALLIEPECVSFFPPPFQIVIVQVRKTPALFAALAALRRQAEARGLALSTVVPPDRWIFHMSVAYCAALDAMAWQELTRLVETLTVPSVHCVVEGAEVVAFDHGQEYSGGTFSLSGSEAPGQTRLELDVADVDLDAFAPLFERLAAGGITFTTLSERQAADPQWLEQFTSLDNETRATSGHPDVPRTVAVMKDRLAAFALDPAACFVARDEERWVGYTVLDRVRSDATRLRQGWTGVQPAYQRRGIGTALKILGVGYARQHGYAFIDTALRTSNVASQALSLRVGFRPPVA